METVNDLFHLILAPHPADKVIRAFQVWIERSQEFPTPADILGLIKRNGRPPLTESMFIQLSKKPGEDRTPADWQYLRDYQREMAKGWEGEPSTPDSVAREQNMQLRRRVKQLEAENERLSLLAGEALEARRKMDFSIPLSQRVVNTVEWMKSEGRPQEDIDAFLLSQAA